VIGGKVLDPSAVALYVQGSVGMEAWLATARATGLVLVLPSLVLAEVQAVFPEAEGRFGRLLADSQVLHLGLDAKDASRVARLLGDSGTWDGTAGQVILVARQRGWPVLTTDPERLLRVAPDMDVELL